MRDFRLLIVILLLGAHAIASMGLGGGLVLCIGPQGHLAIEHAGHEPGCDHGCPDESRAPDGLGEACPTDHDCDDVGLAQQLVHRLPTEKNLLPPPASLAAVLTTPAGTNPVARLRTLSILDDPGGLSSHSTIRTVVLRL